MKRPMFVIGIAFFVTTWAAFLVGYSSALMLSAAAALTAVLVYLLHGRFRAAPVICLICLTAAAAFASHALYLSRRYEPLLRLSGDVAVVEGLITRIDRGPSSSTYTLRARFPELDGAPETTLIIRSFAELEQSEGDVLRCALRLSAAPDSLYYKSRGIVLMGSRPRFSSTQPATGLLRWERALLRLRSRLERNLYANLSAESADVVAAMILGLNQNVSPEVYSAVSRSGTAHILSISGLHLSVLAAFSLLLLKKLRCPGRAAAALTILFCFLFVVLVAFGASVSRSFVMTALALSGRVISRRSDSLTSLGLALLVCCLFWPHWALSWGLWLSAGSTLGIILFMGRLSEAAFARFSRGGSADRFIKPVATGVATSLSAYVFTLPVLLLMSGWISVVSPLANILVAPFVPVVMLGGAASAALAGVSAPVRIIALVTDFSTAAVVRISRIFAGLEFATVSLDESYLLIWAAMAVAIAAALVVFRANKRLVSYALALCLASFSVAGISLSYAKRGEIELVTLTGCDAVVLLRGREAVVVGAPSPYEISKLLKYLNYRGVRVIPALIANNCGDNISSGVLRLAQSYGVDCVVGPNDEFIVKSLETALPGSVCYSGGYAAVTVLGGAEISMDIATGNVKISIGDNRIVKIDRECDIIEPGVQIEIFRDGVMSLPRSVVCAFEPLGARIFGESRVALKI